MSKALKTVLAIYVLSSGLAAPNALARVETVTPNKAPHNYEHFLDVEGWAGSYLSGRFGQDHHDWDNAGAFMDEVLNKTPQDQALLKRAMILAMGSGNTGLAFKLARQSLALNGDQSLPLIFLAAQAIKEEDYETARRHIENIPDSGVSGFIVPLLESWIDAALGTHNTESLDGNTIHIHHAILIADFLGEHDHIQALLERALDNALVTAQDQARIADLYAHIGETEKAKTLYEEALAKIPGSMEIIGKIKKIEAGEDMHIFRSVTHVSRGIASAFHDTGQTLHLEYNDDSARLFAHLAHYLNPNHTGTKFLLSDIAARHERYNDAISFLKTIPQDDPDYRVTQRHIADLLIDAERYDEAMHSLQYLVDRFDDIDALIQIGDIHRRQDDFKPALKAYNQAAKRIGKEIPADYWHLHYMRGICYERLGEWDMAEQELQAALKHEPEHPFVLNYLGYAWADQGENLKNALAMIEQAAALRPADGYITDSLGWVLYRMGRYEDAVPHLEKAVELLPYDPVINDHLGDSYWQVGRKLEARFQWERAKNHAEEEELILAIAEKLSTGLKDVPVVLEAKSSQAQTEFRTGAN